MRSVWINKLERCAFWAGTEHGRKTEKNNNKASHCLSFIQQPLFVREKLNIDVAVVYTLLWLDEGN